MSRSRVLVAIYVVLFLAATGRSVYQIIREFEQAPVAYVLSAVAAVVYLIAGIAITVSHRGRGYRALAWAAVGFELLGVLVVGMLSCLDAQLFPRASVWSRFGQGYLYIPLVLPLFGIGYLESLRRGPGVSARSEVAA